MKIRSIELTNIRRFAGRRASIVGIGDGITVLSEPNEFGKSTFFDALHARLTKDARIACFSPDEAARIAYL